MDRRSESRLLGAVSDLHATDARHHADCKAKCMTPRPVQKAVVRSQCLQITLTLFKPLCESMLGEPSHIWNTVVARW